MAEAEGPSPQRAMLAVPAARAGRRHSFLSTQSPRRGAQSPRHSATALQIAHFLRVTRTGEDKPASVVGGINVNDFSTLSGRILCYLRAIKMEIEKVEKSGALEHEEGQIEEIADLPQDPTPEQLDLALDRQKISLQLDWCVLQLGTTFSQAKAGGTEINKVCDAAHSALMVEETIGEPLRQAILEQCKLEDVGSQPSVKGMKWSPAVPASTEELKAWFIEGEGDEVTSPKISGMVNSALTTVLHHSLNLWEFDTFALREITGDNPLLCICWTLCKSMNLLDLCHIPPVKTFAFFSAVEKKYKKLPFHSSTHAADVVQACNRLLHATKLKEVFSHWDIFALIFAAAIHDVGHPGVNNDFLVASNDSLSSLYYGCSMLENYHLSVDRQNVLANMGKLEKRKFWETVVSLVLATDLAQHKENVAALEFMTETLQLTADNTLFLEDPSKRLQVMKCLLECADVSNQTRPFEIAEKWTDKALEEFDFQELREEQEGLPISWLMDKKNRNKATSQILFINAVCKHLWTVWTNLVEPKSSAMMNNLGQNLSKWENYQPTAPVEVSSGEERGTPTQSRVLRGLRSAFQAFCVCLPRARGNGTTYEYERLNQAGSD